MRISPFTTTPGIAGEAYINTNIADEIIANFESGYSTQYVYKILGLRGSGKSVEYKRVMDHFLKEDDWKVYALPAGGTPMETMISAMSREMGEDALLVTKEITTQNSLDAGVSLIKGGISSEEKRTTAKNQAYFDKSDELRYMCEAISQKGYKILIGIDDIAATDSMIEFLSVIGSFLLNPKISIRLIATGLEKNIEEFTKVPHLSFFARPKAFVVSSLNRNAIAYMYMKLLLVSEAEAQDLARITGGYAWGYQLLGDEYFSQQDSGITGELLSSFDMRMAPTYDLIWGSLTASEKGFLKALLESENGTRTELEKRVKGYSQHRDSLKKKHLLDTSEPGILKVSLPRFKEYVEKNHS